MFGIKKIQILLCFILALSAFFIGSWYGIFLRVRIDPKILEDMVNKSQWVVPLSPWKISDGVLYIQAGYKYVSGWMSWQINPEVPPLAKWGYGLSMTYFQNPYLFAFLCMFIFLFICVRFLGAVLRVKILQLLGLTALVSSPIIFMQLGYIMLELPMGIFFLIFLYPLFKMQDYKSASSWLGAGIGLGLLGACKFPLYPAFLAFIVILWLIKKSKKNTAVFAISAVFAYLTAYIPFFIRGMTIIDWVRNQWWMIRFYQQGVHQSEFLKSILGLLTGFFKDGETIKLFQEWSILWPVLILGNILFWVRKAKLTGLHGFSLPDLLGMGSVIFVLLTPFQARYFFLPFLLLFFNVLTYLNQRNITPKNMEILSILVITIALSGMLRVYIRGPVEEASYLQEWWRTKNYRDIDVLLSRSPWGNLSVIENTTRKVDKLANIESREIIFQDHPPLFSFDTKWSGLASVKMTTPQGSTLSQIRPIVFHREGIRWILDWDSYLAFPGYEEGCSFEAIQNNSVSLFQNWFGFVDLDREAFKDVIARQDLPTLSEVAAFTDKTYTQIFHSLTLDRADKPTTRWVVTHPTTKMHQLEGQMLPGLRYTSIYQNTNPLWERTALGRKVVCPTKGEN